ncbi:cysteine hydrolase family protein [Nocardioides alcanivorans]|uniref:cysteine hydrolase family protein n=1 Tax=Nocardioides alcanivorans TaxID=2897352 RepID=UPI001F44BD72|nr:isochorismatase family cysteine hydrolase [Nocardioides alcanivorans]
MTGQPAIGLVLVDVQNAFFEAGALAQRRAELASRCNALVRWARDNAVLVVNLRTEHRADRSTWTLSMLEDDQGFAIAGDHDAQPLEELDLAGSVEVVKTRDDGFFRTNLGALLEQHRVETLVLAGVSTHTCVATTAAHAYATDLHVVLAHDAIASDRPELHEPTIALLQDEFRFAVLPTASIIHSDAAALTR